MNNFDLRKYLTENKLTTNSSRREAPINGVVDVKTKKFVGTFQYGEGFKANEIGKELGYKNHPTSIPNGTKMKKNEEAKPGDPDYVDPASGINQSSIDMAMQQAGMKEQSEDEEDPYGGVFINGITGYVDRNYDKDLAKAITAFFTTAFPNQEEISSMDLEDVVKVFEHLYRIFDQRV